MIEEKSQYPILKWAQRKDKIFLTINVVHDKKPIIDLTDGKRIKYKGTDGKINYAFDIEFFDEIVKEESKYTLESRHIFLNLKKKNVGFYWPRLLKDKNKYHWIEIDWMYYSEEGEEDEATQPTQEGDVIDDMPKLPEMDMVDDDDELMAQIDQYEKEEMDKEKAKKEGEKKREESKKEESKKEVEKKEVETKKEEVKKE